MKRSLLFLSLFSLILILMPDFSMAADHPNLALGDIGVLPKGDDGQPLNLDFETGTLKDWNIEGKAFEGQPIKGGIDKNRPFGEDKKSEHTGEYWLGGYEKLRDTPIGTISSVPFMVTEPFATFLVAGGSHEQTRVELVRADNKEVFFKVSGPNQENLRPVIVDTKSLIGKKIFIRIVDEHTGGWGHVNFDDFRFHAKKPRFAQPNRIVRSAPPRKSLYPYAGLSAVAAAKAMKLPPGFTIQAAAAEPDVQQPIALAIDDRGRLWVAEAMTYPTRAPEGKGRDRILIFEDTTGDGILDSRKLFAENLNLVSGLEVGFGGVWVGAAPYLLFIPDRDGDDRPDGKPEVLLDGWGYHDTHETLNAFIWGPDGWLYGCHGVFTHSVVGKPGTPQEDRTRINAGVWRYHPVQHKFEVFAKGTSNPWGVDFNDHGQAFCTACVIPHLYHIIQGARYQRQGGQHFNPYTYNDIKTIADHLHYTGNQWNDGDRDRSDDLGGGHAHAGAMFYLGGAWPERFNNQLFMNNIHGNRINIDLISQKGSGYVGSHGDDFLLSNDQWSQMLNLRYGPDGQVWMIDWYDRNQCHRREPEIHDRSNGRIFRVFYEGAKPIKVDLQKLSDIELVKLQNHKNDWYVRHSRRILQERAAKGALNKEVRLALAEMTINEAQDTKRLRALWALQVTGGVDSPLAQRLLADRSQFVRGWAIQLLITGEQKQTPAPVYKRLLEMASGDESQLVRLYIASALQRMPLSERWDILAALTSHAEDASDHNLPLMYWYAAEPLAEKDPRRALAMALVASKNVPILQQYMIRRIGSSSADQALVLLVEGLGQAKEPATQLTFLQGVNQALRGRRRVTAPDVWAATYAKLKTSKNQEIRLQATALALTFGDTAAAEALRKTVMNDNAPLDDRRQALSFLLKSRDKKTPSTLQSLIARGQLRSDALRGLALYDDAKTPAIVLAIYNKLTLTERRDALATLCSRPNYALALLTAIEQKKVPANHLTADLIRQLRNLKHEQLNERIASVWGIVRETAADRVELIKHYKQVLSARGAPVDVELGRAVFSKTCQQCHTLFATGGNVGPDLTGSNRANRDYLLSNMLDPSAVMAKEYQPSIILTDEGRVITGLIRETTADALTVQTANEIVIVPRDEIDEMLQSEKSMMPDDLLKQLNTHEVRSLAAYLAGARQTAMLANADNLKDFFNGEDLAGWRGNTELWSVENGEIVGRSPGLKKNEFLINELAVGDFHLKLEIKLVDNLGNSGIQFRSSPIADGQVKGYQADAGAGWWGKLYEEHGRALLWKESGEKHLKSGQWNQYEIVAVGSRIRTFINGQLCVDIDDPEGDRRGVFALQLHAGGPTEVRFRNIQLVLLSPKPQVSAFPISEGGASTGKISFRKTQLDNKFRSEGAAVGDFNGDGLLDIAAGSVWFSAPDWQQHSILEKPAEFNPKAYSNTFSNFAEDVNNDGRMDLIVVDFPGKPTWWFENPGAEGGPWQKQMVTPVTNNESPNYLDLDGDGRRELILGFNNRRMGYAKPRGALYSDWRLSAISPAGAPGTNRFSHGLGVGDINGDGRNDIVITNGWWEAPADARQKEWEFHAAPFGAACAQMQVYDFDGDGDADVFTSSAHNFGVWWHEQTKDGWKTHEIDKSFSQTHSNALADINGDGLPDIVTGKRFWAHNSHDPGGNDDAVLCWYELSREDGKAIWTKHMIDHNSGVGTQFETTDVNGDGLVDIVTSNKKGVFYFEQVRE